MQRPFTQDITNWNLIQPTAHLPLGLGQGPLCGEQGYQARTTAMCAAAPGLGLLAPLVEGTAISYSFHQLTLLTPLCIRTKVKTQTTKGSWFPSLPSLLFQRFLNREQRPHHRGAWGLKRDSGTGHQQTKYLLLRHHTLLSACPTRTGSKFPV